MNPDIIRLIFEMDTGKFTPRVQTLSKELRHFTKNSKVATDAQSKFLASLGSAEETATKRTAPAIAQTVKKFRTYTDAVEQSQIGTDDYVKRVNKLSTELVNLSLSTQKNTEEFEKFNREVLKASQAAGTFKGLAGKGRSARKGLGGAGQQTTRSYIAQLEQQMQSFRGRAQLPKFLNSDLIKKARLEYNSLTHEFDILNKEYKQGQVNSKEYTNRVNKLNREMQDLRLALRGGEKELDKLAKSQRGAGNASKELSERLGITANKADDVIRAGGRTGGLLRFFSRMRNRLLVATFALAGFTRALSRFTKMAAEAEKQMLALQAVSRNTGNEFEVVQKAAMDLSEDGILSIEGSVQALKNLLSTGADLDIVVENLQAMKEAAVANGRAHFTAEENIIAYTQGIKEQKSQLTDSAGVMTNLSTVQEKYADIIERTGEATGLLIGFTKEANAQFEGALAPVLESLSGKMQVLGVQTQKTQKVIGNMMLPVAMKLVEVSTEANDRIQEWISLHGNQLNPMLEASINIIEIMQKGIQFLTTTFQGLFEIVKLAFQGFNTLFNVLTSVSGGASKAARYLAELLILGKIITLINRFAGKGKIFETLARRFLLLKDKIVASSFSLKSFRATVVSVGATIKATLASIFTLQNVIMLAVTALVFLINRFIEWRNELEATRKEQERLERAAELTNRSINRQRELVKLTREEFKTINNKMMGQYAEHLQEIDDIQSKLNDSFKGFSGIIAGMSGVTGESTENFRKMKDRLQELQESPVQEEIDGLNERFGELGYQLVSVTDETGKTTLAFKNMKSNVIRSVDDMMKGIDTLAGSVVNFRIDLKEVEKESGKLDTKIRDLSETLESTGREGIANFAASLRGAMITSVTEVEEITKGFQEINDRVRETEEEIDKLAAKWHPGEVAKEVATLSKELEKQKEQQEAINEGIEKYNKTIRLSGEIFAKKTSITLDEMQRELDERVAQRTELEGLIAKERQYKEERVRSMKSAQDEIGQTITVLQELGQKTGANFDTVINKLGEQSDAISTYLSNLEDMTPELIMRGINKFIDSQIKVENNFDDILSNATKVRTELTSLFESGEIGADTFRDGLTEVEEKLKDVLEEASPGIFESAFKEATSGLKSMRRELSEIAVERQESSFLERVLGISPSDTEVRAREIQAMKNQATQIHEQMQQVINKMDIGEGERNMLTALLGIESTTVMDEFDKALAQNADSMLTWKDSAITAFKDVGSEMKSFISDSISGYANMTVQIANDAERLKTEFLIQSDALREARQRQEITEEEYSQKLGAMNQRRVALERVTTMERKAEMKKQTENTLRQIGIEAAAKGAFAMVEGIFNPTKFAQGAAYLGLAASLGIAANQFRQGVGGMQGSVEAERSAARERARIERQFDQSATETSTDSDSGGSFGKTVQAQPRNVTINPSIRIEAEVIGMGAGGVEALEDTLEGMIIKSVNNALDTGEINTDDII